jgi:hypothetical protein
MAGGAIYSESGSLSINSSNLFNNTANLYGGGIAVFNSKLDVVNGSTVQNNFVRYSGSPPDIYNVTLH